MPMHDWTRVPAGIYHAFHNSWITHLQEALNRGLLPATYYALGEQRAGDFGPDVLTLRTEADELDEAAQATGGGAGESPLLAVAEAPPQVRLSQEAIEDLFFYLRRQRTIAIRHTSGDRIVALIEILSPANKHSRVTLDEFEDKVVAALRDGVHVLVLDPLPPTLHAPDGIHGAIWERLLAGRYARPDDLPLTLVSYCVRSPITAWIEPLRVGSPLVDMPLFLTADHYIPVPLELTYMEAWSGVPNRWRRVIEQ